MVTMDDVAKIARVSTSTVSHVLNGTRKVSPATVRAVELAIEQLGYIPNTLARSLARSRTHTIGVAISALSNHYFSETVHAIETECAKHGIMMLFVDTHDDPEQELRVVKALHHRRVDGILLAPSSGSRELALDY
ncbi:LacI family DNA-binding transcriptional regulator, partial [Pseudomonas gingeri]